jgi:phosphatidylglycerol:prolipoprotein diacylglycerol transferase
MLAMSFLLGIYLASWRAKRAGIKSQLMLDLSVFIILGAVIGSRLLYVLFHFDEYSSPFQFFALWEGGATFYGGLILSIIASVAYTRRKNLPFLQIADIFAPSIALGMALTRVGCFLSGCCYGIPTDAPWGVVFPNNCPAGYAASDAALSLGVDFIHLHPTQLYSSLYGVVIVAILLLAERGIKKRGALFGLLLVLSGAARFIVDFFRFYEDNARVLLGLTFSQILAIGMAILGAYLLWRRASDNGRAVAKKS